MRSSYGDKTGALGELWMLWAREAIKRWIAFDDEWGREFRLNLFHTTGDLIMRTEWDNFQLRTKVWWDKNKIPYQILNPDDVRKAFPVISMDDITAVIYEPDAGVVRARRAAQTAAAVFEKLGGKIVIGRATPSKISNGRLEEVTLDTGATLRADKFVFAVGPWLGKTFPDILAKKTRVPIGYVCYFGTPIGDHRFTFPNLPSFNFPGVTGWPALPVDNRGFRVRGAERAPTPPGERSRPVAVATDAATPALRLPASAARRTVASRAAGCSGGRSGRWSRRWSRRQWWRPWRWWRRWRRWRRRRRSTGRRSARAAGSGYERSLGRSDAHRRLAPIRRAPLPDAQGRADRADARLPLRVDVERQLHHRHPPGDVERLDRRGRQRRGLQVQPSDRRVRGAARDGHRGRRGDREGIQNSRKGIRSRSAADSSRQHASHPGSSAWLILVR